MLHAAGAVTINIVSMYKSLPGFYREKTFQISNSGKKNSHLKGRNLEQGLCQWNPPSDDPN